MSSSSSSSSSLVDDVLLSCELSSSPHSPNIGSGSQGSSSSACWTQILGEMLLVHWFVDVLIVDGGGPEGGGPEGGGEDGGLAAKQALAKVQMTRIERQEREPNDLKLVFMVNLSFESFYGIELARRGLVIKILNPQSLALFQSVSPESTLPFPFTSSR